MRDRMSVVIRGAVGSPWSQEESESWRVLGTVYGMPLELGVSLPRASVRAKQPGDPGDGDPNRRSSSCRSVYSERARSGYVVA